MKINPITTILLAGLLGGCAPAVHRGSVAMKLTDDVAHVCLGINEVKPGDSIHVLRNVCKRVGKAPSCELKLIGHGKITEVLNDHYSVATLEVTGGYQEGDVVEKSAS